MDAMLGRRSAVRQPQRREHRSVGSGETGQDTQKCDRTTSHSINCMIDEDVVFLLGDKTKV